MFGHLPDTGVFTSAPDAIRVHDSCWERLKSGTRVSRMALWDAEHKLFARIGHGPWDDWLKARGMRKATSAEMRELHVRATFVEPVTLPTLEMIEEAIAAGIVDRPWMTSTGQDTPKMAAYRAKHMRSHRWCAMHDAEFFRRLKAANWPGNKPALVGKWWVGDVYGAIYGAFERPAPDMSVIQPLSTRHASVASYSDYMTLVYAAIDGDADEPHHDTDPSMPAIDPKPTKLGQGMPPLPADPEVMAWQELLNASGYGPLTVDGRHGKMTQAATEAYFADHDERPTRPTEMPRIITTHEWGAVAPRRFPFATKKAAGILLHHMASENRAPKPTSAEEMSFAKMLARNNQRDHMSRGNNTWADTGQHFTVTRGGIILEGRTGTLEAAQKGLVVEGAHSLTRKVQRAVDVNDDHWGIESEGNYHEYWPMPTPQWDALVELVTWLVAVGALSLDDIHGHRDYDWTVCPGELYAHFGELKQAVERRLG